MSRRRDHIPAPVRRKLGAARRKIGLAPGQTHHSDHREAAAFTAAVEHAVETAMARYRKNAAEERAHIDWRLDALELHRQPRLWNVPPCDTSAQQRTITEAAEAALPEPSDQEDAFRYAIERFAATAQGPLLQHSAEAVRSAMRTDALPIPPPLAREQYFADDDISYWVSGFGDRLLIETIARQQRRPIQHGWKFLDFGSSSGRVLRHFAGDDIEAWGVDLGRQNVDWVRQHLAPAVNVIQGSTLPYLPFPDNFFDCVFAGSVFTHIDEFEEAWLLELRRVLAPGGIAILTFHPERAWADAGIIDDHPVRMMIEGRPHRLDPGAIEPIDVDAFSKPMPAERVVLTVPSWPVNNANVFHTHAWVRDRWGAIFAYVDIVERAHAEHQDAAILRKRAA